MIDVKGLTLTYRGGKGVFDLDFKVGEGVVMGYLGPNGAGKTTTIRALLGFMAPNKGAATIAGLDCVRQAPAIQKRLGYIPGEIAFLDGMNGDEFLRFMRNMRGVRNLAREKQLIDLLEFSPRGKIKKFSKGMKQKLGIVAAFMHDPDVYILDEPTSGLDPLMQARFVELVLAEKQRGKTVLMSSHMFEEVEKTCDHVLMIKDGRIVNSSDVQSLKSSRRKAFALRAADNEALAKLLAEAGFEARPNGGGLLEVGVPGEGVDTFLKTVARVRVLEFDARAQTLEDVFMQYYGKEGQAQ